MLRPVRRRFPRWQQRADADARLHDGQHGGDRLMAASEAPAAPAKAEPRHGLRIFLIWLVLALAAAPVMLFVWVYFGYALVVWRHRKGDDEDGPPIFGHTGVQATFIGATSVIVLAAFVFGTVELIVPAGAGAGEGALPVWKLSGSNLLQVQVIGQQWSFTYRYPQFGGMETTELVLPVNRPVEFHVTSLDVIHSFWAYQLGVKADANPNVDDVAYVTPETLGSVTVRCNEL